jgi:DNA-binding beta-propeller fold protein YncE
VKKLLLAAVLVALSLFAQAAPAWAVSGADPLFVLQPDQKVPLPPPAPPILIPPPAGNFEGPCGLVVDAAANFYVADYYHHTVDVYSVGGGYLTQLAEEDPLDGPCGLALDPAGNLYVNNYHRNVVRFGDLSGFGAGQIIAGAGADSTHPTGVAVDGAGTAYVDARTRIASFDGAGLEGEAIGEGSLEDAYGLAVSGYPATAGYLYVPDAATNTIKVFDPATSTTDPVEEIDGSETPLGRFTSLRDSAVAVDNARGTVYVVDDLTPEYTEGHEGVVYAFDSTGAYQGRLKYSIQTALPAGLAVDNSALASQGRVYVTSGYTELASVYAYAPGSAGTAAVPLQGSAAAPSSSAATASPPTPPSALAAVAPASVAAPASAPAAASSEEPAASPVLRAKAKRRHHHRAARRHKR